MGLLICPGLTLGLFLAYACSGVTIVAPKEVGLIRRLGRWVKHNNVVTIFQPGLILAWPYPIDHVVRLPVKQEIVAELDEVWNGPTKSDQAQSAEGPLHYSITGDHNVVELKASIRFRIEKPEQYAVAFQDPKRTIQHVVQTSIATTVSRWSIDEVLTQMRLSQSLNVAVLNAAHERLQQLEIGAQLTTLELTVVRPPAEVRDAFLAVNDARVEQESWRQEALGQRTEKVIEAETVAQQAIADSKARLVSRMAQAKEESAMFQADLIAFQRDRSEATVARLRRDAWEKILAQKGRIYTIPRDLAGGVLHLSVPDVEKSQ